MINYFIRMFAAGLLGAYLVRQFLVLFGAGNILLGPLGLPLSIAGALAGTSVLWFFHERKRK